MIGEGGQGIVYACEWQGKNCAIKQVALAGNKAKGKDLFQELQIMVEKKSDKIVKIYGYSLLIEGEELKEVFILMERYDISLLKAMLHEPSDLTD